MQHGFWRLDSDIRGRDQLPTLSETLLGSGTHRRNWLSVSDV